jgi:hypothetical protein
MKHQNNLSNRQQEQQAEHQQQAAAQTSAQGVQDFGSVEEMLRHDATHTPLPPAIGKRLEESLGALAPPPRSWWRRFFGT